VAKLTAKQQRFIEEYCSNGFNATRAAMAAGYSEKTAKQTGCENLTKHDVQEGIQAFMSKATKKAICTVEDVVNGLLTEAQYNGEGSSQSARVAAWKALSDYTGGFDVNKQKVDHSSSDGSMTPSKIELVVAKNDNKED
ncbi:terminase small subunit, partial [Vibrio phage 1.127.O._10N.286.52.E12]